MINGDTKPITAVVFAVKRNSAAVKMLLQSVRTLSCEITGSHKENAVTDLEVERSPKNRVAT